MDVYTWWRHAATCAASAGTQPCSGLQVTTAQLLSPELQGTHDGWALKQVERMFAPLRAEVHPLSSVAFQTGMAQLRSDLAAQHATGEARELAQHADNEAREDHRDAMQTFEGRFGLPKLEEILRLLNKMSQDDLPELLHALGHNKKKSDDALVLQMVIDNRAASPASAADEYTKPVLSTQIIDAFTRMPGLRQGSLSHMESHHSTSPMRSSPVRGESPKRSPTWSPWNLEEQPCPSPTPGSSTASR